MAMERWECPCGLCALTPAEGDAENNIPAGTAFEDLPAGSVCPKCGAEKEFLMKCHDAFLIAHQWGA